MYCYVLIRGFHSGARNRKGDGKRKKWKRNCIVGTSCPLLLVLISSSIVPQSTRKDAKRKEEIREWMGVDFWL